MSIAGVSNSSTQAAWQAMMQQDLSQLTSAYQNGGLQCTQNSFASMLGLNGQGQNSAVNSSSSSSTTSNSSNPLSNDFSALSKALQSGNLAGAQSAFAQLQTDMQIQQSSGGHHHHHHHHGGAGSYGSSGQGTSNSTGIAGVNVSA